jgi:hypothetical protein
MCVCKVFLHTCHARTHEPSQPNWLTKKHNNTPWKIVAINDVFCNIIQTSESSTNLEELANKGPEEVPQIMPHHSHGANMKNASHDPAHHSEQTSNKDKPKKGGYASRAFALNKPELPWAIIGVLGAMMNGAIFPVLATLLVNMLGSYFLCIKLPDGPFKGELISVYNALGDCRADCYHDKNFTCVKCCFC